MKRKIKILHLLNTGQFSGAENVVCQIINMFANDADIEMAYASPDGQIREALAERGISFFPMKKLRKKELRRAIKAYAPDILHAHDVRAAVLASLFHKNVKLISTIHVNDVSMRSPSLKVILFCAAARKIRHIFWVSRSCFEQYYFKALVASKSSVLTNVIDRDALIGKMRTDSSDYPYEIIYVGRLTAQKDPLRLAEVLALAAAQKQNLQAAVIGSGDLEDSMKARIKELGIERNVCFLGFQSNPLKMMRDAKVMLMTSAWEGTPMCALEAMALGVPIVSTPADGMRDLVLDGKTGYLSEDNAVLAERMVRILQDPQLYKSLSAGTEKRFAEISDIKGYKKSLKDVYCR